MDLAILAAFLLSVSAYGVMYVIFLDGSQNARVKSLAVPEVEVRVMPRPNSLKNVAADYLVRTYNLRKLFAIEETRDRLHRAGKRGVTAEASYLASKLVLPFAFLAGAFLYLFVLDLIELPLLLKTSIMVFAAYIGMKLPDILIDRAIRERQESIQDAWPDALDLMIILVEGGSSVDAALRRVASEIGIRSKALAEDLTILLTEMSLLPERRTAFENFSRRSEVVEVKSACMAFIQSDDQGTQLAPAFKTLAADGRAIRLARIEKKAAAVAAIMALPVAVFFLLPLMVLAVMPAAIDFLKWN